MSDKGVCVCVRVCVCARARLHVSILQSMPALYASTLIMDVIRTGQEESGLEQSLAREQAPQGGPKGIPTATVAGGMQQHGAGATAREQALQPEQAGQQQAAAMDTEEGSEREGAQEQSAEVREWFIVDWKPECDLLLYIRLSSSNRKVSDRMM